MLFRVAGFLLVASAFLTTVNGTRCGCPVTKFNNNCQRRDLIAQRWVNASDVTLLTEEEPTVGHVVFGFMQKLYSSGLDYFSRSLARDGNPMIDPMNDIFTPTPWCYHADMTDLSFTLPSGSQFLVDLELRSRALLKGFSLEICGCKDKNRPIQIGAFSTYRSCPAELILFLKERAEYRMTEIVDTLRAEQM